MSGKYLPDDSLALVSNFCGPEPLVELGESGGSALLRLLALTGGGVEPPVNE